MKDFENLGFAVKLEAIQDDVKEDKRKRKQLALDYHKLPKPGKFDIFATKSMSNAYDLSLAYSPGVAEPCLEIQRDPTLALQYTNKGNMVACISNGTAVLGLGNIGALASKPVMEGKAVLFKKFGGVNCIDICVDAPDKDDFINCVKHLAPSFGGINLEDIKGPDCFYVEEKLKELMPIPVFHDDQHGTAIICLAALINALDISKKDIAAIKIVCNGAGAAGIACMKLITKYGAKSENCFVCDTKGVIYPGRKEGMNEFKMQLANSSIKEDTSLADICKGCDVLIGVSAAGAFTEEVIKNLNKDPVIFAMANPTPEVLPEVAKAIRDDIIIATGRSDYPNQVNNVMCFPYLFRAALDTKATQINEEMKMAAAGALAALAREPVPPEVKLAVPHCTFEYGPGYIIPSPFDPRLLSILPVAIAKAAMESGAATYNIPDMAAYAQELTVKYSQDYFQAPSLPGSPAHPLVKDLDHLDTSSSPTKLFYFGVMGRTEPVRMLLHYTGIPWEDVICDGQDFIKVMQDEKLDLDSMPMLEVDGVVSQTQSIIEYIGVKMCMQPTDLMLKDKGKKIVAYLNNDVITPLFFNGISIGTDEEKKEKLNKLCSEQLPSIFKKLAQLIGGDYKFIVGDTISQYDCQVGGWFASIICNPKAQNYTELK